MPLCLQIPHHRLAALQPARLARRCNIPLLQTSLRSINYPINTAMPIETILQSLSSSPSAKGALSGAASGALVSALMNKKARKKLGGTALKLGGLAAVAGAGYYAYRKWQEKQGAGTVASRTPPSPAPASLQSASQDAAPDQTMAAKLVLAMIAAAEADSKIDAAEMDALLEAMDRSNLPSSEKASLTAALNEPPTLEEVAALAESPEQASELYAASLAAIHLDTPAETLYLRRLARALSLDQALTAQLHREVGMPAP